VIRWLLILWGVFVAGVLWAASILALSAAGASGGMPAGPCVRVHLRDWNGPVGGGITQPNQGGVNEIRCGGQMWAIY
jgi:hypothetical protein